MADAVEHYVGVDIVADLLRQNQQLHGNARRELRHLDIIHDSLPRADVILCRDCLVHLSHADIFATVTNFRRSGGHFQRRKAE